MDENKRKIINLFLIHVKGKRPVATGNQKHDGKYGHWLEQQMGIPPNADNKPDIFGYEMKNHTAQKTSFGDWSADYYIFRNSPEAGINRDNFLTIFGKPNIKKSNRYSWSGEPCPKVGEANGFGQKLIIDSNNNIIAHYCYSKDMRPNKHKIVPTNLQIDNLILARWSMQWIKGKLEKKFNQSGWFKCKLNQQGVYDSIVFGAPINFNSWIEQVKQGVVIFDSGMYQGNSRNYSMWRANNKLWDSLILEEHR